MSGSQQQTSVSDTLSEEVIRALRPVHTAKTEPRLSSKNFVQLTIRSLIQQNGSGYNSCDCTVLFPHQDKSIAKVLKIILVLLFFPTLLLSNLVCGTDWEWIELFFNSVSHLFCLGASQLNNSGWILTGLLVRNREWTQWLCWNEQKTISRVFG